MPSPSGPHAGWCHRRRIIYSKRASSRCQAARKPRCRREVPQERSAARLPAAADDGRTSVRAALSSACGARSTPAAIIGIGRAEPYHVVLVCVTIRNRDLCVDLPRYLTDCGREKIAAQNSTLVGRIAPSSPTISQLSPFNTH